jgi:GGDEF domain-containing protein
VALAVVIGSLVVACLALLFAARSIRSARRSADERVAEALSRLADGMHETMRELTDAVAEAQSAGRIGTLTGSQAPLDFDGVTNQALNAAVAIPGVEGALLEAVGPSGRVVTSAVGLADDEAPHSHIELPTDRGLRAVEVSFGFPPEVDETRVVRSGVVVPLRGEDGRLGTLSAFSRSAPDGLDERSVDELALVAERTGPALVNARRFSEARDQADLDALTGLHNARYFHELLGREVARAHRYRRRLSLLRVELPETTSEDVLVTVARTMRSAVRAADVPCRVGPDAFAIVLPESELGGTELLSHRISRALAAVATPDGAIEPAYGLADLRPGDRESVLFARAGEAFRQDEPDAAESV